MRILPSTGILIPTANNKKGEGIDRLETARLLIENSFIRIDDILGGINPTVIRDVEFDRTTKDGDFVYLREDGVFAPALAEFSARRNVVGAADTVNNKVIFIGAIHYPNNTDNFKVGDYLYLSPRVQGEVQTVIPPNAPEILVGLYLGNNIIILNIASAVSDYLQKGIPDGSIGTSKLESDVIAPFATDIVYEKGLPKAKDLGLLSLTSPVYTGDINKVATNSNYCVKSSNISNGPIDFDKTAFGVLETKAIASNLACQTLWSVSDTDNIAWFRRKCDNTWTAWSSLNKQANLKVNKEIFYNTLLLGSQYQYCYYNVLDSIEGLVFADLSPTYNLLNNNITFSTSGESFSFTPISENKFTTGFKVILHGTNQNNCTVSYSVDSKPYKVVKPNEDVMITFRSLSIKITGIGDCILDHFGVLYNIEQKLHTDSSNLLLRDNFTGQAYKLSIVRGEITATLLE